MATQAAAAKTHGVAIKLASATKITNAAIWYYVLLRCIIIGITLINLEGEWVVVWMESSIFFSCWTQLSLQERITKCKTIIFYQDSTNDKILHHERVWEYPSWISLWWWLIICHLEGNLWFWIPQKVFGDLFQRSHFFSSSDHLKTWLPNHWCPFSLHSQGWMPCNQQSHIATQINSSREQKQQQQQQQR